MRKIGGQGRVGQGKVKGEKKEGGNKEKKHPLALFIPGSKCYVP